MITATTMKRGLALLASLIGTLVYSDRALAANPIKLVQSSQMGWEVNKTTKTNTCATTSNQCQPGQPNTEPGGFKFPEGVAGATNGNFYVTDQGNHRVQGFEADGKFLLMFGKEVNQTTHENVCTQEEIIKTAAKCTTGATSIEAGQFETPKSIVVDPVSGNIYIAEGAEPELGKHRRRVQEFTATGQFVLEIGKEVNKTTKANLCTEAEIVNCGPAQATTGQTNEHGALDFEQSSSILTDGGEHDLLYVAEVGRIQEFDPEGEWKGEIPLKGTAQAIALDDKTGNVYLAYKDQNIVQELGTMGEELGRIEIPLRNTDSIAEVSGLAIDSPGHVAVALSESIQSGWLYDVPTGPQLPGFTIPAGVSVTSIGFNGGGELYAAAATGQEILSYTPEPVAELVTGTSSCMEGLQVGTSVTFDCQLHGEVNPFDVPETEALFEWGRTCTFGSSTSREEIETVEALLPVSAAIGGLRPNESFCYRLAGYDQNVQPPEGLGGEPKTLVTPVSRPKIIGAPKVSFIKSSSVVLQGELNPENATTEYIFEYAPDLKILPNCKLIAESCPGVGRTTVGESALYGGMGVTLEASGLQPDTTYQYRLAASNQGGVSNGTGSGQEGSFTTLPSPGVQAETGSSSEVTPTSALVSGIIDPDGQPATYTFELGVYQGANTQFGTVFSGPTGTSTEGKSLRLTGLQSGTEYAYRINILSGYGIATGATMTFKTGGLPTALVAPTPLPMLPIPKSISFPKVAQPCKQGYTRGKQGRCVRRKIKKAREKTRKNKKQR